MNGCLIELRIFEDRAFYLQNEQRVSLDHVKTCKMICVMILPYKKNINITLLNLPYCEQYIPL